jgi:isoaspartyl peptidase/L-asparaginase-like protein (Ntn-hydrolase superfamily)
MVNIDRPGFMFNPTSCKAQQITANISGNQNATAPVASPFAAAGCKSLEFKPQFKVTTSGHTSRAGGASLDAKVIYPSFKAGSEANIARVKVDLPRLLPSRLTTLQKACTAVAVRG